MRRRIRDSVKHVSWKFFAEIINRLDPLSILEKISTLGVLDDPRNSSDKSIQSC